MRNSSSSTVGRAAVRLALSLVALVGGTAACTNHQSYVSSEQASLGRVVIYRNGVAYYERTAAVDGDRLVLRVPQDKIDDFLKSLTVADAKTKEPLPISFPAPGQSAAKDGWVEMVIQLPDSSRRDVVLSYVTESPAWKPTYRLVVADSGKVDLQGWAIVDNTSGEDWKAVKVGVGSSSALSFRYDLHSIRTVHRETLRSNDNFAKAPPIGGAIGRDGPVKEVALASMSDEEIARPVGHPDVNDDAKVAQYKLSEREVKSSAGGSGRGLSAPAPSGAAAETRAYKYRVAKAPADLDKAKDVAPEDKRVAQLVEQIKHSRQKVVVEGYANAGEADGQDRALDRANMLRNQLIERGVAPAQVAAVGRGVVAGQKAGIKVVAIAGDSEKGNAGDADAAPVGESHFDSGSAMSVLRGTSAMVSILQGKAQGEVVYLYDPESRSGDSRYAFKSVRFKNPTGSTLESGPITVYGAGRFIGEGLAEPIPPGATAVIPFALDRQVLVDRTGSTGDRMSKLVKLNRGALTAEVQHLRSTQLKITNRSHLTSTVLIRHTTPKGWQITSGPKPLEQLGDARLFAVEVPAGESRILKLEEATPLVRTVDLRSQVGVDLVRVYLQTAKEDDKVQTSMKKLLALFDDMAKAEMQIAHLRERGGEFRVRMDELENQIFSLKAVKTGGQLMVHLQQKMREISEKVQGTTLDIVKAQERMMLAKVSFQDELAELTLDQREPRTAEPKSGEPKAVEPKTGPALSALVR